MKSLYVIALLAVMNGGYMVFDTIHQFATGDFVRVEGQLGPWANLVTAIGIDPLSLAPFFLLFGITQIICAVGLIRLKRWGYRGTLYLAIASLLYLVFGTVVAILQLILLKLSQSYVRPKLGSGEPLV